MIVKAADFSIDIGSANTVVSSLGGAILFDEPTRIALDRTTKRVIAFGHDSALMTGKGGASIDIVHPISRGAIADPDALFSYLSLVFAWLRRRKKAVLSSASLPMSQFATVRDRSILERIFRELGILNIHFLPDLLAEAMAFRTNIDITAPLAIIDFGAEVVSWGVVRNGSIDKSEFCWTGIRDLREDIICRLRMRYGIELARSQAETVLFTLGFRANSEDSLQARVACKNIFSGQPGTQMISAIEIAKASAGRVNSVIDKVKIFLEGFPESDLRSFLDHGVQLCGGGPLIPGLTTTFATRLGFPVMVSGAPLHVAAIGAARAFIDI